jgi:hypothetical protein
VAKIDMSAKRDPRFYLPEVRQKYAAQETTACAEADQTISEITNANDGILRPENAADYEAIKKVCQDTFDFLSIAQEADRPNQWVAGVDGGYVLPDGPLKDRFRAAYEKYESDSKKLGELDNAAQTTYERQQSDGKK